jgi:hypothetical protein
MRYYKLIYNGYIQRIGVGDGGIEITQEEYKNLFNLIQTKPIAESGYGYRLKEDLTWELFELPVIPEEAYSEEEMGCY